MALHASNWEDLQVYWVNHEILLVKPFIETLPFWDQLWVLFPCHAFINFQDNPLSNWGTRGGGEREKQDFSIGQNKPPGRLINFHTDST